MVAICKTPREKTAEAELQLITSYKVASVMFAGTCSFLAVAIL